MDIHMDKSETSLSNCMCSDIPEYRYSMTDWCLHLVLHHNDNPHTLDYPATTVTNQSKKTKNAKFAIIQWFLSSIYLQVLNSNTFYVHANPLLSSSFPI